MVVESLHLEGYAGFVGQCIVVGYRGGDSPHLSMGFGRLGNWMGWAACKMLGHHNQCLIFLVVLVSSWRFLSDDL